MMYFWHDYSFVVLGKGRRAKIVVRIFLDELYFGRMSSLSSINIVQSILLFLRPAKSGIRGSYRALLLYRDVVLHVDRWMCFDGPNYLTGKINILHVRKCMESGSWKIYLTVHMAHYRVPYSTPVSVRPTSSSLSMVSISQSLLPWHPKSYNDIWLPCKAPVYVAGQLLFPMSFFEKKDPFVIVFNINLQGLIVCSFFTGISQG